MDGAACPISGWRFEVADEIGSTSDALIERAGSGEAGRLALLARRQTRARGSRGRSWSEPPSGNLAMSVLLRPEWMPQDVGRCVFAAGLAFRAALQAWVTNGASLALKWPNDVLLEGRKLGGVLLETACGADGRTEWMVIGFGANLLTAPVVPGRRTACLAECAGLLPDAEALGAGLLAQLDGWFGKLMDEGFETVRSAWLEVAHPAGTLLTVGGVEGRFAGVSAMGELLFRSGETVTRVRTGDVMLAGG
jgi:BirA family biotin operon repressor/biotin-[acetyl-CoA-carboxylase] ligase